MRIINKIIIISLLVLLTGCNTSKNLITDTETSSDSKIEQITDYQYVYDSIYIHDIDTIWLKNDTVEIIKWRNKIEYQTILSEKTDTIIINDTIIVNQQIEAQISNWDKFKQSTFWYLMGIIVILLLIIIIIFKYYSNNKD